MSCEHPVCSIEANTICKSHCQLSVCQQHRLEHEKDLLKNFEKQSDNLANIISILIDQSRSLMQQSEQSRLAEINRINSLFDCHISLIDERLHLSKKSNELIITKREELNKYKNGDKQLTKEDFQQLEDLSSQIQKNLLKQYELNNQINNKNLPVESWQINSK